MNRPGRILSGILAAVLLMSCVNPEYDLDQIIVDEVHVLDKVTFPIGGSKPIYLHEVMGNLEFDKYLKARDNGDYYMDVMSGQLARSVEIPSIVFDGYDADNPNQTTINTPIMIPELSPGIKFGPIEFTKIEYDVEIDQTDIPELITDIVYADVSADMTVKFSYDTKDFPFNKIYIQEGLALVFPTWIVVGNVPVGFEKVNHHTLQSTAPLAVTPNNTEICIALDGVDFTKMPENQGIISPGHLYIDAHVEMDGSIYVMSDDCTSTGLFYPIITTYLHMDQMKVESVEANINIADYASMDASFSLNELSEDIGNEQYTLDFDDLKLGLDVTNSLPFSMNFNAEAQASINECSDILWSETLNINAIPAAVGGEPSFSHYIFELNDFPFSPLPDRVDFHIAPVSDEMFSIVVKPESSYEVAVDYSLTADSFGKDFCIKVNENINGLGLDISEADVAEVVVKFNLINALPFDFDLKAQAIDVEGNTLDHIALEMSGDIKAGSLQSPAVNPVMIRMTNKGQLILDGVHLDMTTAVSGEKAVLNKNQYIQLTDISVCLPKGITYNYDDRNY